jgi:hypothetical protein
MVTCNTVETKSSTKLKVIVVYPHPYPHSSGNMLSVDERYVVVKRHEMSPLAFIFELCAIG